MYTKPTTTSDGIEIKQIQPKNKQRGKNTIPLLVHHSSGGGGEGKEL